MNIRTLLAVALVWAAACTQTFGYGETQYFSSYPNNIPAGWVMKSATYSSYTIINLNGASYGYTQEVSQSLNYPEGWVMKSVGGLSSSPVYTIIYLIGAPDGATQTVRQSSGLPPGWTVISYSGSDCTIRYTDTALAAPNFTIQPISQTVTVGQSVSFSVAVDARSGAPSYQWYFNGTGISGANSSTLTLPSVTIARAGNYHCLASNRLGSVASTAATLTVNSGRTISSDTWMNYSSSDQVLMAGGQTVQVDANGYVVKGRLPNDHVQLLKYGPGRSTYFRGDISSTTSDNTSISFAGGYVSDGYMGNSDAYVTLYFGNGLTAKFLPKSHVKFAEGYVSDGYLNESGDYVNLAYGSGRTARFLPHSHIRFAGGYVSDGYLSESGNYVQLPYGNGRTARFMPQSHIGFSGGYVAWGYLASDTAQNLYYGNSRYASFSPRTKATFISGFVSTGFLDENLSSISYNPNVSNIRIRLTPSVNVMDQMFAEGQGLGAIKKYYDALNKLMTAAASSYKGNPDGSITVTMDPDAKGYQDLVDAVKTVNAGPNAVVESANASGALLNITIQYQYPPIAFTPGSDGAGYVALCQLNESANLRTIDGWASVAAGTVCAFFEGYYVTGQRAPVFTKHPASQTVAPNSGVSFTVAAYGSPAPTYQWQYRSSANGVWTNVAGATGTTYSIPNVTAGANGFQYRCVATNVVSPIAMSDAATLTVTVATVVNRQVDIAIPVTVMPGQTISIPTTASTNAVDGEQIGFYHLEYSINGGATWTGACYDVNVGVSASRTINLTAGAADTIIKVRSRIAFRGGVSGDVDFNGTPINWGGSWDAWQTPPTKYAEVRVQGESGLLPATITLKSVANNMYVCADNAGADPLVANRTAASGWETFDTINNGDGTFSFRAWANGKLVCAESGGASALIANRDAIGGWERFYVIANSNGTYSFQALANNMFVCAESTGLIADRAAIGPWEQFWVNR